MNISSTLLPTERLIIAAATCSNAAMARFQILQTPSHCDDAKRKKLLLTTSSPH
jgi:hypothetical protein